VLILFNLHIADNVVFILTNIVAEGLLDQTIVFEIDNVTRLILCIRCLHFPVCQKSSSYTGCRPFPTISPSLDGGNAFIPDEHRSGFDVPISLEPGESLCNCWNQIVSHRFYKIESIDLAVKYTVIRFHDVFSI
jgi:hypothetical protein